MSDYEYEIKKTGNNKYTVTPIPAAGCGAGCGIIVPILLGFIGFLLLGNAIMDDGAAGFGRSSATLLLPFPYL